MSQVKHEPLIAKAMGNLSGISSTANDGSHHLIPKRTKDCEDLTIISLQERPWASPAVTESAM